MHWLRILVPVIFYSHAHILVVVIVNTIVTSAL